MKTSSQTAKILPDTPKQGPTITYTSKGIEVDATNAEIPKVFISWAEADYRKLVQTRGINDALDGTYDEK